ncbi:MAG: T9SS type A sorting domain-containing protein, partial [Leeuwenhoekiella sp.]
QKEHDEALVPQDDVHRYDPETDTWSQLADMPEPFNHIHASVFLYGDYIYSIGGQIEHNATPYASVYAYDPVENTWQQFTDLPARRFSIVGAGIDGKLYASGGNNARTTYVATLPEELLSNEDAMQVQKNALKGIKIYPNPAKNEIFVTDIDQNLTISNIGIYDITGRLVQDYSSEITGSKRSFQFPISQLLSGVYIMRITNENGEILNKQILIE